ncbi:hypothetical protein G7Y89_g1129 [Cudoniella acicularis]|uniref:Uncharacterized protein n=1 Tax=Cudoniella acicularis TaxID=354080 RepID=A0A8H4WAK2_9HELO|nr:hypothetical protein G7Y89_g1129 [Cudoniella acicularis]
MDSLPTEILGIILSWDVRLCRVEKNLVLPLRLVCKAFDAALRPYIFKTIQLEFSRFCHNTAPCLASLARVGYLCGSIYLDMMVIRDEEEISRLTDIFQGLVKKVPEMIPLLQSLRKYCMSESTFDETDFRRTVENVLERTPSMRRLKMNLPFQVVGTPGTPATILLATTLACLANRGQEDTALQTLVIDHVSDTTINNICRNPADVQNFIRVFEGLKNLVLSIKRQESQTPAFNKNLWFLIRKATKLDSLCMIGWNVRRDISTRRHRYVVPLDDWRMRSLPYPLDATQAFTSLRFLELKRVDIDPHELVALIKDCSATLKELYIIEVYIKVHGATDLENISLWIGRPGSLKPPAACWVAQELRNMESLELSVLRATGLGYDDFEPDRASLHPNYDLKDHTGLKKSFDRRFVEAVMECEDLPAVSQTRIENIAAINLSNQPGSSTIDLQPGKSFIDMSSTESMAAPDSTAAEHSTSSPGSEDLNSSQPSSMNSDPAKLSQSCSRRQYSKLMEYDAETFQRYHNTTSQYKRSIDGHFYNHNEQALKELQNLINVADRGMTLISAEIESFRTMQPDANTGIMMPPGAPPPPSPPPATG